MGRRNVDATRIIKRDGWGCHYCGVIMNVYANPESAPTRLRNMDKKRFTFEHIVPRSIGGTFGLYNLVGACAECNGDMGNDFYKCFCEFCKTARVMFEMKELREMRFVA